jgi:BirA family transcriptional regulator, biotin operon repressor / biotin---[acetyl-CoA-carboxylase] ligase
MLKNKILDTLYRSKGDYVNSTVLASELDVTKTEIWENIQQLIDQGYIIDSSPKMGYRLVKIPNLLLPNEIKRNLNTQYIGNKIHYFKEVDSTNEVAKALAKEDAVEGTTIIAERQSRGKGRHGKKWISPSGGVWMSIILRPEISPVKAPNLTLITGVAVAKTIKMEYDLDVGIKWPNDIIIGEKKVCGILIEVNTHMDTIDYLIVGIGIDANVDVDLFPPDLREGATSLKHELKKEISGVKLVQRFLKNFEIVYNDFKEGSFLDILKDWRKFSKTVGNYVEIIKRTETVRGEAVGINNEGALIIELDDGNFRKVISGECFHIKRD